MNCSEKMFNEDFLIELALVRDEPLGPLPVDRAPASAAEGLG